MNSDAEAYLGPVAHVAFVVVEVSVAMKAFQVLGTSWSTVRRPTAKLRMPMGEVVETKVDYVTSSRGEPRVKLVSAAPGTLFSKRHGGPVHHVSYWVEDLDKTTERLIAAGWIVEATGLDESARPRYRYLRSPDGRRSELGVISGRDAFDAWAENSDQAEETSSPS